MGRPRVELVPDLTYLGGGVTKGSDTTDWRFIPNHETVPRPLAPWRSGPWCPRGLWPAPGLCAEIDDNAIADNIGHDWKNQESYDEDDGSVVDW
jgi:hypothetical protein